MRYLIQTFILLALMAFSPQGIAADTVNVRAADHDAYSRLVFDWGDRVDYAIETSGATFTVKFKKAANPAVNGLGSFKNMSNIRVPSTDPLIVSFDLPSDSRTRDFYAGNRLVVDVYNSPSGKKRAAAQSAPKPEKASKTTSVTKPTTVEQPLAKIVLPSTKKKRAVPESQQPKKVEQSEPLKKKLSPSDGVPTTEETNDNIKATEEEAPSEPIIKQLAEIADKKAAVKNKSGVRGSTLVSFSTTKVVNMAAFQMNDQIWMVNDNADVLVTPQVSGAQAATLKKAEKMTDAASVQAGQAFVVPMIKGADLRAEGGGLVWRVVQYPPREQKDLITPTRDDNKIMFPLVNTKKIVNMVDPRTGYPMFVVTADAAGEKIGTGYSFVEFDVLPSALGIAVRSKVDDLSVKITQNGVEISRPRGVVSLAQEDVMLAGANIGEPPQGGVSNSSQDGSQPLAKRIFDLKEWQLGGIETLDKNKNLLLERLNDLSTDAQIEGLIKIAKMHLSHAHGIETIGFLTMAKERLPSLERNVEFKALYGAGKAMAWDSEEAFLGLRDDDLNQFPEIGYWKAYALADLGDWQQARASLPNEFSTLQNYTPLVFNRLAPVVAEILLRAGDVDTAQIILEKIYANQDLLFPQQLAAWKYLKGEAARQDGDIETTKEYWEPLATGRDDLYRAKAGLALTRLLSGSDALTDVEEIDKLERLRYAWRGDELETQIHYRLAKAYFEAGEHGKALNIMREAVAHTVVPSFGERITGEMRDVFTELFLEEELQGVSPLDAAALYEQFSELIPAGPKGDEIVEILADHLSKSDLLGRASGLLQHQLEHRLSGVDAVRVGARLAAIRLLDGEAALALKALDMAQSAFDDMPEEQKTEAMRQEIALLRARALSQSDQPQKALFLLEQQPRDVNLNLLRADIAWRSGYWDDAAEALDDVITDRNISLNRPLTDEDTGLIVQRAIALNLSGNRIGLANMREKYGDPMAATSKRNVFDVVSRPRQIGALADRETLMGVVAETDLFADFLESYKAQE